MFSKVQKEPRPTAPVMNRRAALGLLGGVGLGFVVGCAAKPNASAPAETSDLSEAVATQETQKQPSMQDIAKSFGLAIAQFAKEQPAGNQVAGPAAGTPYQKLGFKNNAIISDESDVTSITGATKGQYNAYVLYEGEEFSTDKIVSVSLNSFAVTPDGGFSPVFSLALDKQGEDWNVSYQTGVGANPDYKGDLSIPAPTATDPYSDPSLQQIGFPNIMDQGFQMLQAAAAGKANEYYPDPAPQPK